MTPIDASPYVYLTVTYRRDLENTKILCESLQQQGDDTPHLLVVHTEDVPVFCDALAAFPNVSVHPTVTYLGVDQDAGRQASVHQQGGSKIVRSLRKRLPFRGPRTRALAASMSGWHHQQITKIKVASQRAEAAVVILDSDLMAVRKPLPSDFLDDQGRPYLFARQEVPLDEKYYRPWLEKTLAFIRPACPERFAEQNYVFGPVVWSPKLVRRLTQYVNDEHRDGLLGVFADGRVCSEYYLYGVFVEAHAASEIAVNSAPLSREMAALPEGTKPFTAVIAEMLDPDRQPFLWVQGFLPLPASERRQLMRTFGPR